MCQLNHRVLLYAVALLKSCTCDLRQVLRRQRSLVYPDPGESETKVQVLFGLGLPMEGEVAMNLGYVLKCNYNLPHNASIYTRLPTYEESKESSRDSADEQEERAPGVSRWSLYRLMARALDKSCLLRAVCEVAGLPFLAGPEGGLLGELLHVLFTPSTTDEGYEVYADREYRAAEASGRDQDCRRFHNDCDYSPLEYFTRLI